MKAMMFWVITCAMALIVVLVLARALWRNDGDGLRAAASYDVQVYRDQLAEVERDVTRGVISAADAERARTEISRRILAADGAVEAVATTGAGPRRVTVVALGLVLIAGSFALYTRLGAPGYGDLALADRIAFAEQMRESRPSQQAAVDSLPNDLPRPEVTERHAELLDQLRETVAARPNDIQGHRLLARSEADVGDFVAAAAAQRRLLDLLGPQANATEVGDYAELLVLAAGGYVSPEAEVVLREVLTRDPEDGRARYYIGLMLVQTGRPDQAFRLWDGLLRRGPATAPWIAPIRAQIMTVAALSGVDYDMPEIGAGRAPGPSEEDIEAAKEMTSEERMEMIGGMVSGLSDRLAREGGPPEDWARLIVSLGVLNERVRAGAIFDNAMEVFAGDDGALDTIRRAGQQAGVSN